LRPHKIRKTGLARSGEATATAADWSEAALHLIAESGLSAVTVETVANRLGVTKGSFYWHFRGRSELLAAALGMWEQRTTTDIIKGLEMETSARRRLEFLLQAASQPPRPRSMVAALAEGLADPIVKDVLTRVTSARIGYVEACYRELGAAPALARSKAVFAYAAYRGLLQLAREAPAAVLSTDWPAYPALVRDALIPKPRIKRSATSLGKTPVRGEVVR